MHPALAYPRFPNISLFVTAWNCVRAATLTPPDLVDATMAIEQRWGGASSGGLPPSCLVFTPVAVVPLADSDEELIRARSLDRT